MRFVDFLVRLKTSRTVNIPIRIRLNDIKNNLLLPRRKSIMKDRDRDNKNRISCAVLVSLNIFLFL